jgi:elongation factor G
MALAPIFKTLDDHGVPHIVFVNKVDHAEVDMPALMEAMQSVSERPLVLRELPIREGEKITGYVDLVSERAYRYQPGKASELIKIPDSIKGDEGAARTTMLEALADFDDALLEKLLEDAVPPPPEIYAQCAKDFAEDKIVPVFLGAAEQDHGVRRLLKALRHETPDVAAVAARRGLKGDGEAAIQVFKTNYALRSGKLSYARVLRGEARPCGRHPEQARQGGLGQGGGARAHGHGQDRRAAHPVGKGAGRREAVAKTADAGLRNGHPRGEPQ